MEGQHCALTEAHKRKTFGGQTQPRQFGIQILVKQRRCCFHAFLQLMGIDARDGKPLIARSASNAGRRIGSGEGNAGKHILPMLGQAN